MKKKFFKSTLAVVLVAAAAFGGVKTYGTYNATSESDLLTENVEALSDDADTKEKTKESSCKATVYCYLGDKKIGEASCTGTESCKVYLSSVECDGTVSSC